MTQQTETSPATIVTQADRNLALAIMIEVNGDREKMPLLEDWMAKERAEAAALITELESYARETSIMLSAVLGGGSEWFKQIGDKYYVCPKLAGDELQRRKTDAITTKKDLRRAKANTAELVEALEEVRSCRLPPQHNVQTMHGVVNTEAGWVLNKLTKLLPKIDALLAKAGDPT